MAGPRRRSTTRSSAVRRPADDDVSGRLEGLESRLAEMEEGRDLRARGRSLMERMVPAEASRHFRTATREELLGVRAIVDFWIRRLESLDAKPVSKRKPGRGEPERIEIE